MLCLSYMGSRKEAEFRAIAAYLPRFVVEEEVRSRWQPRERGRFREGTLLFADVSGFTAMSEKLSAQGREGAEELTSILNSYFTRMLGIASSYKGFQLKFGGDAMLILFSEDGHAARSVRCACKMQEAMRSFKRLRTSQGVFQLKMSIGIHSGEFFTIAAGAPGEQSTCAFAGREVERTAEVESAAGAGEVVVSEQTLGQLPGKVELAGQVKGHHKIGRFGARVATHRPSELDLSTADLEQSAAALAHHFSPEIAARIKSGAEGPNIGSEHRRVTTIFVNMVGATAVIEEERGQSVDRIAAVLDQYYTMLHRTTAKYGGAVLGCDLSASGEKVLLAFGAPVAHEDDDERAVRCALELRAELKVSGLPLTQRMGINTGPVFSGDVGSPDRKEYTVMGDSVNLAARLMSAAREGEILIGRSTRQGLGEGFALLESQPIMVKGKRAPVALYSVEGTKAETRQHGRVGGGKLVGRDAEVEVLRQAVKRCWAGKGQVVAVSGPAGIGKSRLLGELGRLWRERGGSTCDAVCQSYGTEVPFLPWIQVFDFLFDLKKDDSPQERAARITGRMLDLCPGIGEWTGLFANLLNAPLQESDALKSLDGKLRHQRLLDVTLELLRAGSARTGLAILFEDAHWADAPSLELLNHVTCGIADCRLLVCVAYRPEKQPGLDVRNADNFAEFALKELSPEGTVDFVRSLTRMRQVPDELGQLVIARSQGNPLYAEELVRSIMESGYLDSDSKTGEYRLVGDLSKLQVPDTIEGVIVSRLDRLDEVNREVLKVASVIGRSFQHPVLKHICPGMLTEDELRRHLGELSDAGLVILEAGKTGTEYSFQHILTREVAYESLPYSQRRDLHHRVGEYFEATYPGQLEEYCELLFYHYDRTKDSRKAFEYSLRSAGKGKDLFANQEAIKYYQRALELAGRLSGCVRGLEDRIHEDLGDICELTGRYDEALSNFNSCRRLLQARRKGGEEALLPKPGGLTGPLAVLAGAGDRDRVPVIYRKTAMVYERMGQYGTALKWLDNGLRRLANGGVEKARVWVAKAGVLYRRGEHMAALEWCRGGLDIAARAKALDVTAHGYYLLGTIHTDMGNVDQAVDYRLKSLNMYEEMKHLPGQARVHNNLGVDYYYLGNWGKSREHYEKSLKIRQRIGDVNGVATVSNNLGEVLSDQGHVVEAIESFQRCICTWQRTGYQLGIGLSRSNLGLACVRLGQWQEAIDHLREGAAIFERLQAKGFLAEAYRRLAEANLGLGTMEPALSYGQQALSLARQSRMKSAQGVSLRTIGKIQRATGQPGKARRSFELSLDILRKLGVRYELALTERALVDLLRDKYAHAGESVKVHPVEHMVAEADGIFRSLGVE